MTKRRGHQENEIVSNQNQLKGSNHSTREEDSLGEKELNQVDGGFGKHTMDGTY